MITAPEHMMRPQDRRREERLDFEETSHVQIVGPAWVMTKEPMHGVSENITRHGIRINHLSCKAAQLESWNKIIESGGDLKVEISFPGMKDFPSIQGNIVWIYEQHAEDDSETSATHQTECAFGVLFTAGRERQIAALDALIDKIQHS